MAEIINLRQAKKTREIAKKAREGTENAARYGRSKALKSLQQARAEKERRNLDRHKVE